MVRDPIIKATNLPSQIIRLDEYNAIATGFYKPFDDIDTKQLRDNISNFEATDTSKISDEELKNFLESIISEIIVEPVNIEPGTQLYRARHASFTGMTYNPYFEEEKEV